MIGCGGGGGGGGGDIDVLANFFILIIPILKMTKTCKNARLQASGLVQTFQKQKIPPKSFVSTFNHSGKQLRLSCPTARHRWLN
jgi:hypothetical protein